MRLIDADELIETLKEDLDDADIQNALEFFGVYDFIENQPTAFDKEKVVKELEKKKSNYNAETEAFWNFREAIGIVKRGGIDGN